MHRRQRLSFVCILLALLNTFSLWSKACGEAAGFSGSSSDNTLAGSLDNSSDEFTRGYSDLTKRALTAGIELERFNLNYRLQSVAQPKWRALRFSLGQEAGAAGILAFETTADRQFAIGRKNPAKVSNDALRGGLIQIVPTSAIAGASSCLELGSNAWQAKKNRRMGLGPKQAMQQAVTRFNDLEKILQERQTFVNAHKEHPAYARALAEGQILDDLRRAEIDEFIHFFASARAGAAAENTFYVINAITNILGATAGGVAFKSVIQPKFGSDSNVLFTAAGSFGALGPWLSARVAAFAGRRAGRSVRIALAQDASFDSAKLTEHRARLRDLLSANPGSLIPSLPAVERLALYTESNQRFKKQLETQIATSRHLARVALQQELLAPLIGGTLTTQGILGEVSYYRYGAQPRKQLSISLAGSITSTAGGGLAVTATAAALLASWAHERSLERRGQSSAQLIHDRLHYLEKVEKIIQAI